MGIVLTDADFEALTASEAANEDIIAILLEVRQDRAAWEVLEVMMSLSNLRAAHRIAGALQAIETNIRLGKRGGFFG